MDMYSAARMFFNNGQRYSGYVLIEPFTPSGQAPVLSAPSARDSELVGHFFPFDASIPFGLVSVNT